MRPFRFGEINAATAQAEFDRLRAEFDAAGSEDAKQLIEPRLAVAEAKIAATGKAPLH